MFIKRKGRDGEVGKLETGAIIESQRTFFFIWIKIEICLFKGKFSCSENSNIKRQLIYAYFFFFFLMIN